MRQKNLIIIFFLIVSVCSLFGQEKSNSTITKVEEIVGLQIYPNPVSNGRVYISTENTTHLKVVEIYDMLGKKVLEITLNNNSKEINLTQLTSGVYIIKVKENNRSETRKLVIK